MRRTHPERAILQRLEAEAIAPDGAGVLVACSGGPDSVALASLIARLAPVHRWSVVLGHVNHGLRASAWQDEAVVVAVGARLGVPVRVEPLAGRERAEGPLRDRRYAALAGMAAREAAGVVLTAHTAEDQTESVLLALFRGTGLRGLAGMPARRKLTGKVQLVRPLLGVSRAELHAELGASALPYVRDPTNADLLYRRNAVRDALQGLRQQFPRLDEAVARCAAIARDELASSERGLARRRLRDALQAEVGLSDVPFERIEAVLAARRGRVYIKHGVEVSIRSRKA